MAVMFVFILIILLFIETKTLLKIIKLLLSFLFLVLKFTETKIYFKLMNVLLAFLLFYCDVY